MSLSLMTSPARALRCEARNFPAREYCRGTAFREKIDRRFRELRWASCSLLNLSRNSLASRAMSLFRSRGGGNRIGTTLMR